MISARAPSSKNGDATASSNCARSDSSSLLRSRTFLLWCCAISPGGRLFRRGAASANARFSGSSIVPPETHSARTGFRRTSTALDAIDAPVDQRLGDVFARDAVVPGKVGDRARDAHDAVEGSCAERTAVHRALQELERRVVERAEAPYVGGWD